MISTLTHYADFSMVMMSILPEEIVSKMMVSFFWRFTVYLLPVIADIGSFYYIWVSSYQITKNPKLLLVKGFRSGPTRARTLDPLIMSQVL